MAKEWVIEFDVISRNKLMRRFPIDMLRHDSCYPENESESVSRINETLSEFIPAKDFKAKPITLIHLAHGNKNWKPTEARWYSFGYKVIETKPAREV
jgi:hypothetical protein